jgi:phage terminase large subunit-like protein
MNPEQELAKLIAQLEKRRATNKLEYYVPYEWQKKFHNATGYKTGRPAAQRVALAGNGTGKTICGAMETAIHLTGLYPDWWKGHKFYGPVVAMVGGITNEAVRDINQKHLFGDPNDPAALGTGSIPRNLIGKRTPKPGVPQAFDTVLVKHKTGKWSKVMFRAYEQGPKKHMGHRIHLGWLDEEPPQEIWSQYLRGTISMNGILFITFTPESGLTEVVNQFMNNLAQGQALIQASWNDSPHLVLESGELTDEAKQLWAGFPPHEREMRMRGVPVYGKGLVFSFTDDELVVEPFPIPRHWPQITGIDFGWDHPFAAARLAWDRDSDVVYLVSEYRAERQTPAQHAAAVLPWGKWIPVAWPHDGLNTEKGTGDELRKAYQDEGLNMLPQKATNPPQIGQKEGEGGNSAEASILAMYERMETGRWKVFSTCRQWSEERRIYHRDENAKLVKLRDDLISASRYAHMMLRHARVETVRKRAQPVYSGLTNW